MGGRDRPASSTEISAPFWRETVKKRRRPSSDETLTPRDELAGFCGAREKARRPTRWALVPCMRRGGPCVKLAWDDETAPTLRGSADRRRRPRDGRRGVAISLLVGATRRSRLLPEGVRPAAVSEDVGLPARRGVLQSRRAPRDRGFQAARRTRTTGREFGPTTTPPRARRSATRPNAGNRGLEVG